MTNKCCVPGTRIGWRKVLASVAFLLLNATPPTFAGQTTFQYDNLDRLERVIHADGSNTRYAYDADGNRRVEVTSGVTPTAPTLSVTRTPSPMVSNQNYTISWASTNAVFVTYACTSTGTGFASGVTYLRLNGSGIGPASAAWVGFPSTCTWRATSASGEVATVIDNMVTLAAAAQPTLLVTRTPSPMVANQNYTITWVSTNAVSVTYACTSTGTGFASAVTYLNLTGSGVGPANANWVGYPSQCIWRARSPSGAEASVMDNMVTVSPSR